MKVKTQVTMVALGVIGLSTLFGSFYTVEQGERGIVTRFGAVASVEQPGLHFKLPYIETSHYLNVRTNTSRWELAAYSSDQQPAKLGVSISWHINEHAVEDIFNNYKTEEAVEQRVVGPRFAKAVKDVFGQYTAKDAIQKRMLLGTQIEEAARKAFGADLTVESLQVENIDYSQAYENAVEARMLAEVEVAKLKQREASEEVAARITVIQAKAQADSTLAMQKATAEGVLVNAHAKAEATQLQGEAEAAAIKAKGDALSKNPSLVALTKAERWDGVLPKTMLPNASVPFIDANHE